MTTSTRAVTDYITLTLALLVLGIFSKEAKLTKDKQLGEAKKKKTDAEL